MKEYKYKINGNPYNVVIGDIEDNIAHVEVNGTHYNVEMEKKQKLVILMQELPVLMVSMQWLLIWILLIRKAGQKIQVLMQAWNTQTQLFTNYIFVIYHQILIRVLKIRENI